MSSCVFGPSQRKGRSIQFPRQIRSAPCFALALALAACGERAPAPGAPGRASAAASEANYHAPPAVRHTEAMSGGALMLSGAALPGARVRLATPTGEALYAEADSTGAWRLALPAAPVVRLFGLSMSPKSAPTAPGGAAPRVIQAEGYLAVTPEGQAAELRAGAGAAALGEEGFRIAAVDFDREGGAVVSGVAAPRAALHVLVDGAARGAAPVAPAGGFSLALNAPLSPGRHLIAVADGAQTRTVSVLVVPAAPLAAGPFRAQRLADAWRIDWITPGGGLQSTLLFDRPAPRGGR